MGIQPYTMADLKRLRSLQFDPGRSRPQRKEFRRGLRMVRLVRWRTDSGALVLTREHWHKGDHKDVTVRPAVVRGSLISGGGR
ncbi:hypothetical protein ACWEN6_25005 [Sphaerisporangium sp. NPDC004334]